jgi:chromosome segregation ATPase
MTENTIRLQIRNLISLLTEEEGEAASDINASVEKMGDIKKRLEDKLQADEKQWDSESQLKGKLPNNNPEKKGLTAELPEKKKEIERSKKDLKAIGDLEKKIKTDLKKVEAEVTQKTGKVKSNLPGLPDLPSAI